MSPDVSMVNTLKMAQIHTILELRRQSWSFRRIARELGVHRETVARHVRLAVPESSPSLQLPIQQAVRPSW